MDIACGGLEGACEVCAPEVGEEGEAHKDGDADPFPELFAIGEATSVEGGCSVVGVIWVVVGAESAGGPGACCSSCWSCSIKC